MPSRRSLLGLLGSGLAVSLGGCADSSDPATNPESDGSTTTTTGTGTTREGSDETTTPSTQSSDPVLSATELDPDEFPDGTTLVPVSPRLRELIAAAATTDGRVDSPPRWRVENREPLVLDEFDYLRYQGKTYEPTAEFRHFAQEASYRYTLESVNESEFDGDVVTYANLSTDQRSVANEILENGSYGVGFHETLPKHARDFQEYDGLQVENETYRLMVVVGDSAAHHTLRLDPANPDEDARVVTISETAAPQLIRNTVQRAVSDGSATVVNPDALRSFVENTEYVLSSHAVARLELDVASS